jgi:NADH-quinone oxidoreductase subunit J
MNLFSAIFYILAIILLASTAMAVTRRHPIHAVVYLILSFIATGLLFYLLGAPFLALLEVIIYAGAIMVLFLFIVMMLRLRPSARGSGAALIQWLPAAVMGGISFVLAAWLALSDPGGRVMLKALQAGAKELGLYLFQRYWFPVEIASFLLLIALVGALYLSKPGKKKEPEPSEEDP